jgi:hypothetical protein
MKRTQIYLTNEQWQELSVLSANERVPVSELIRRAIDQMYKHNGHDDFDQALDAVTGMWKDRTDLGTTEEYVRSLREDDRLERFGL